MDLIQAFVLGLVQGLTEFIPISSSAHLIVVPWLFGWSDPGLTFDVALHVGTLVAVLAYFARDLVGLVRAGVGSLVRRNLDEPEARLAWLLVVGTLPALIAGLVFNDVIDAFFHIEDPHSPAWRPAIIAIAVCMAGLGAVLLWVERWATRTRKLSDLSWRDGILVGLAQAFALLPGVSRSGSTLTAGLALGLQRDAAARFSFLLSIPVTAGAISLQAYHLFKSGIGAQEWAPFVIGIVTSGVAGYAAIHFLLQYLRRESTAAFVYYRWAMAVGLIVVALMR